MKWNVYMITMLLLIGIFSSLASSDTVPSTPLLEYALSGGSHPSDYLVVDDDLTVYVNGNIIFDDDDDYWTGDGRANWRGSTIKFRAHPDDTLQIVASNRPPMYDWFGSRVANEVKLSELYIHVDGDSVKLTNGIYHSDYADDSVFFDETYTLPYPPPGSISVSSTPLGADIYHDGEYKGTTPKTISDVQIGSHTIRLEKSGYGDATRTVNVLAGETATLSETLIQKTGSISISSSPSGADIYLDGMAKGVTPKTISGVIPGSHTVKLEKYGYEDWLTSISVTSETTTPITAQLTPSDTAPPTIRIDTPTLIEHNNNGILEEGESLEITYGATDDGGVASIKLLLDGATLESQNRAGTYTATSNPLSVGTHTIRVEATDSRSNSGFEEIQIPVERAGPSIGFVSTRTTINKGEDTIFTLSAVNPIGNPPMTVQLILKPPSGVSVTSSSFAKGASGIYTCTQTIESGDNVRSIEVHLIGNEVGTHEIESEVYYQFEGNPKSPTRYETLTLVVDDQDPTPPAPMPKQEDSPGFAAVVAVIGLLAAYLRRKRI